MMKEGGKRLAIYHPCIGRKKKKEEREGEGNSSHANLKKKEISKRPSLPRR